jgi:hypothetical protein
MADLGGVDDWHRILLPVHSSADFDNAEGLVPAQRDRVRTPSRLLDKPVTFVLESAFRRPDATAEYREGALVGAG